ncbi:DUF664 domain-containing protein [Streptomyces olivochromogenes]|uniref:mycothiol transferase n=1 Tax=Streptomyces olivochromogenes TaxID=1963 RepID=UPI0036DE44B6
MQSNVVAVATPNLIADEKTTLHAFLQYLRQALIANISDLGEADACKVIESSGKSMVGLLRHLTMMEAGWFSRAYAGEDVPFPLADDEGGAPVTAATALAAYRAAAERSDAIIARTEDLDLPGVRTLRPNTPERPTLRWVMVHLIEDTARHTGHTDNIRDDILGVSGDWRGSVAW